MFTFSQSLPEEVWCAKGNETRNKESVIEGNTVPVCSPHAYQASFAPETAAAQGKFWAIQLHP